DIMCAGAIRAGEGSTLSGYVNIAANVSTDDIPKIHYSFLLRDLLNNIVELQTNATKLFQFEMAPGGVFNVDFSRLEDLCMSMMSDVRMNINKLRVDFSNSAN